MSKELEALENLYHNIGNSTENYLIIETAIIEKVNIKNHLDEIFENHNIKSFTELNERLCDYNELKFDDDIKQKKLKAFEIIIKKNVNIRRLKDFIKNYDWLDDKQKCELYNKQLADFERKNKLTQEEYDLLKEVLL